MYTTRGRCASEFPACSRGDLRSGTPMTAACTARLFSLMLSVSHTWWISSKLAPSSPMIDNSFLSVFFSFFFFPFWFNSCMQVDNADPIQFLFEFFFFDFYVLTVCFVLILIHSAPRDSGRRKCRLVAEKTEKEK